MPLGHFFIQPKIDGRAMKLRQPIFYLATAFFITACGGGSSSSNSSSKEQLTDLTGQVSGISGVSYVTFNENHEETGSGIINSNNEFTFNAGDSIALYLGGAELGSAPAQRTMRLIDFFSNMPQDAASFRQSLRQPEYSRIKLQATTNGTYYSKTQESSLYRASNTMRLLIALDADKDTSNGLDLLSGDWLYKLADETADSLNLNANMFEFADSQAMLNFQNKYDISINMDVSTPLASLYDLAQIQIQANRRTGFETPEKVVEIPTTYEYDEQQRIIKQVKVVDYEKMPKISTKNIITTTVFEYDDRGNLTKEHVTTDNNNDGVIDNFVFKTMTYNDFGKLLTLTLDEGSNPESTTFRRKVSEYTYANSELQPDSITHKTDFTADGHFDVYTKNMFYYNANGTLKSVMRADSDESGATVTIYDNYAYTYNEQNLVSLEAFNPSFTGPNPDREVQGVFTYNQNSITKTTTTVEMGPAIPLNNYKSILTEEFDENGFLTKKIYSRYANDELQSTIEVPYTYDAQQRMTQCQMRIDSNADAQVDRVDEIQLTYTNDGAEKITTILNDNSTENTATYGPNARLEKEPRNDDTWEYWYEFNYSANTTNDGVRYLVHEYLYADRNNLVNNPQGCELKLPPN